MVINGVMAEIKQEMRMKKLILLCTVFVGVIANAYINEDNEYAPNPTAKEIVIYDSGDAPKQEVASKDFANLKLLKSRSKTGKICWKFSRSLEYNKIDTYGNYEARRMQHGTLHHRWFAILIAER